MQSRALRSCSRIEVDCCVADAPSLNGPCGPESSGIWTRLLKTAAGKRKGSALAVHISLKKYGQRAAELLLELATHLIHAVDPHSARKALAAALSKVWLLQPPDCILGMTVQQSHRLCAELPLNASMVEVELLKTS